jgi:hypothetical protein
VLVEPEELPELAAEPDVPEDQAEQPPAAAEPQAEPAEGPQPAGAGKKRRRRRSRHKKPGQGAPQELKTMDKPMHHQPYAFSLTIPPLAVIFLKHV